jgi:RNA polymerase sigma-70 factor (ECF subfamily)
LNERSAKSGSLEIVDDKRLWRDVLAQMIPKMYSMFVRKGINQSLAEELTQKTVFDAVKGIKTFSGDKTRLSAWMMGIAKNNLAMEMRKRAVVSAAKATLAESLSMMDSQLMPDEVLEQKETAELVNEGLEAIDEKERDVLKAKYVEGLPAREIAGKMKMTERAVHSLLYRARNSLREKLRRLAPCVEGQSK